MIVRIACENIIKNCTENEGWQTLVFYNFDPSWADAMTLFNKFNFGTMKKERIEYLFSALLLSKCLMDLNLYQDIFTMSDDIYYENSSFVVLLKF